MKASEIQTLPFNQRSYCGELSASDEHREVHLFGWVHSVRDLGGIAFIHVRDVTGTVQVVVDSTAPGSVRESASSLRNEFVVYVTGTVKRRSPEAINPSHPTGDIEVIAISIGLLNESLVPPFLIDSREQPGEEIRLRYRFLDLRREDMRESMIYRHKAMQTARRFLSDRRFIEIETPILNKSTPEGARDFLVPSRVNRGKFYALPQSPQLFKQILMVSGYDRYFQIVKCFRDEDLRHDRQPEFTQIDLEFSFIGPDIIMNDIEGLLASMVKELRGIDIPTPFPRITYDESMERFGCDAPDTRFGLELKTLDDIFTATGYNLFAATLANGGAIRGMCVPDGGGFSRKAIDALSDYAKQYGAKGLSHVKYTESGFDGGIGKFLNDGEKESLIRRFSMTAPSIIFFVADAAHIANDALAHLRTKIARDLDMVDQDKLNFLWVTEFPLFQYDAEGGRFQAVHHPFTAPTPSSAKLIDTMSPEKVNSVMAMAYDVVLNGSEIGGGSMRIHTKELQGKIFSLLGISPEEASEKFSFLLEALQYGAPPHGGIALGLDRIMMILLKRHSIRDVIAFPKTQKGQCLMSDAPSPVSPQQLEELAIKTIS